MQSSELRELTASEPLTLEEEYDMQRKSSGLIYRSRILAGRPAQSEKWQNDEDSEL